MGAAHCGISSSGTNRIPWGNPVRHAFSRGPLQGVKGLSRKRRLICGRILSRLFRSVGREKVFFLPAKKLLRKRLRSGESCGGARKTAGVGAHPGGLSVRCRARQRAGGRDAGTPERRRGGQVPAPKGVAVGAAAPARPRSDFSRSDPDQTRSDPDHAVLCPA